MHRSPTRLAGAALIACVLAASCSSSAARSSTATSAVPESSVRASASPTATTDSVPAIVAATTTEAPTTTVPARQPVKTTGPITGGAGQAPATTIDLAAVGYVEQEFFIEGKATSYDPVGTLGVDGKWTVKPGASMPYRTRIIVRRPKEASAFSGTVLVEWLNVSAGADGDPDWGYASDEIIRSGDAWVGVSAQAVGVNGGGAIVGGTSAGGGLVKADPVRYGSLVHPGDAFSFDIFTQAATALRAFDGPSPVGDLKPTHIIAAGESQSAFYMTTYINAIQPIVGLFDGFFVHSRGGGAPTLGTAGGLATSAADAIAIRDDLDVPVLVFLTETDLTVLGYGYLDQPDSKNIKVWETAGTAHADSYLLVQVYHLGADSNLAAIVNCAAPLNAGPQHELLLAALHHLVDWVANGNVPPTAPRLELSSASPPVLARDDQGIAIGGIRSPLVDVPVAVLSGDLVEGATGFCALFGSTTPFDAAALAKLYPTGADYLKAFRASTQQAVDGGFLLDAEARTMIANAEAVAATFGR